jgi:abortive infection bacteriophage resistance protein
MTYDRPWRAFAQQLDLLKFRGMIIGDETLALHRLEHIGYYRLSAYWYPFRSVELTQLSNPKRITCNRKDLFEPGTQFEDALALYEFDKRLRLLLYGRP